MPIPQAAQQIRFCTSRDRTRIAYATCGSGPPLIWRGQLVHHLEFDWDSPVWRPWLNILSQRHTVIRYDWRGCGLSDRDNIEFSPEKHIEDLEAVVAATGHERFVLLGHGGGGMTSIAFAVRHPQRVSRLVLYNCPARGRLARAVTALDFEEAELQLRIIELGWPNENPAYGKFFTSLHLPDASPELLHSYNDLLRLTSSRATAIEIIRACLKTNVRELAPNISCPTLVLHASEDAVIPFDEGRRLAALIPGARFVPLESRNHILVETEPAWEQFVEALNEFLPGAPAGAANVGRLPLDSLTAREREVLEVVAQGLNNDQIANQFGISNKTVRNHVSTIFSKLGVNSRVEAVVRAREAGLGKNQ
jgi:pimeloyl-ACP methyl ester carboxylesterase/DNA-binding CsgD family transcriptional regulator